MQRTLALEKATLLVSRDQVTLV